MFTETQLFATPDLANAVHEYIDAHSSRLPDHIKQHREDTIEFCQNEQGVHEEWMISPLQAQFLIFLTKALRAKRVLDIGCFTGFSAISWAHALKDVPGAEVVTLDLPGKTSEFAKQTFEKAGANKIVRFVEGPATETLAAGLVSGPFDLIFIDANKDGYWDYVQLVLALKLLKPDGLILADNALRAGLVADRSAKNPHSTDERAQWCATHLDRFNKLVRDDPRVENVLMPIFDGINFIMLKDCAYPTPDQRL